MAIPVRIGQFSRDPKTGKRHRHHLHSDTFCVYLRRAVQQAKLNKHVLARPDIRVVSPLDRLEVNVPERDVAGRHVDPVSLNFQKFNYDARPTSTETKG